MSGTDPHAPPAPQTGHAAEALAQAAALRAQGRLDAATSLLMAFARSRVGDADAIFECAQFIRQCGRHGQAAELCELQCKAGPCSPRLLALAGNIAHEAGHFEQARGHYLAALRAGVNLNEWFVLQALANTTRYTDAGHADFALFAAQRGNPALTARARASVLFAFGKACDDIGEQARAATLLREANALAHDTVSWSRNAWSDFVESRLRAPLAATTPRTEAGCTPVFVVGMVRSGTTLVADRLGRHPDVRNRGELPFMGYLAGELIARGLDADGASIAQARRIYLAHLRQDDAPAAWYVDKHPLNFRHLGVIAAMFPEARVIWCRRNRRDNALSIWSQLFGHADNDYAYDFDDIAAYGSGCDRLMAHWRERGVLPIHVVDYEQMVAQPEQTLAGLHAFLGLPATDQREDATGTIASASMWQARQPIYRRSVARWCAYAPFVPELVDKFDDVVG